MLDILRRLESMGVLWICQARIQECSISLSLSLSLSLSCVCVYTHTHTLTNMWTYTHSITHTRICAEREFKSAESPWPDRKAKIFLLCLYLDSMAKSLEPLSLQPVCCPAVSRTLRPWTHSWSSMGKYVPTSHVERMVQHILVRMVQFNCAVKALYSRLPIFQRADTGCLLLLENVFSY